MWRKNTAWCLRRGFHRHHRATRFSRSDSSGAVVQLRFDDAASRDSSLHAVACLTLQHRDCGYCVAGKDYMACKECTVAGCVTMTSVPPKRTGADRPQTHRGETIPHPPGRGTGCMAGVWAFRAEAPSWKISRTHGSLHVPTHGAGPKLFLICVFSHQLPDLSSDLFFCDWRKQNKIKQKK